MSQGQLYAKRSDNISCEDLLTADTSDCGINTMSENPRHGTETL